MKLHVHHSKPITTTRTSIIPPTIEPISIDEHELTIEELQERFGDSINLEDLKKCPGLSHQSVLDSIQKHGVNRIPSPKKQPLYIQYFKQFTNLFSVVLFICGALSIIVFIIDSSLWVNLYTGLIFWGVAFFNAALEFWQVYSSAKTLEGFLSLVPTTSLVVRDGQMAQIPSSDLVVGDIISLSTGNKVPADVRILWSEGVRVDNSSLTGESEPQERNAKVSTTGDVLEATCLLFSSTIMISGEAVCLVVSVGKRTAIGRIAAFSIEEPNKKSKLELEMTLFIRKLVIVAFCFACLALALGFSLGLNVTDVFDATIGIFVSFLPQGLPATMTILLTSAAKRMAKRNVLVKDLRSVETLGSMTMLATDKTGTLTQNKMAIVGGWIHGQIFNNVEEIDTKIMDLGDFLDCVTLCTSCKLDPTESEKCIEDRHIFGDATEVGILHYTGQYRCLDSFYVENEKLHEIPFSSETKWHSVVVRMKNKELWHIVKGAPERVLSFCDKYEANLANTCIIDIDDDFKERFKRNYHYFAVSGLRILAVAMSKIDPEIFDSENPPPNDKMTFLGFVCLRDPPKPGVQWAVNRLHDAGIEVIMVTGDHPFTAEAIARQVNILTLTDVFKRPPTASDIIARPNVKAAVIHGENLDGMTLGDWQRICSMKELVFARTAPRHKLEIVKQFQNFGHIVAVSGDGVNDSPALRKANLGISMNRTASDVSKDAAHMILLDDNFVSIVAGVFEGRLIFENVKKSIRYTLTHITSEVSALLIFSLLIIPPPLSPILLIFIDVAAELGPAVSFAGEPPEYDLMDLEPRERVERTISADVHAQRTLYKYPFFVKWFKIHIIPRFHLKSKGEALVDFDLAFWSFLQGGVIVALGAWGAYVIVLAVYNVPFNILYRSYLTYFSDDSPPLLLTDDTIATAADQVAILGRIQAAYFLAILLAQWFNVFVQKHRYRLPFGYDMLINKMTYIGIFSAMCVAAIVAYIPALNDIFKTEIPPALALAPPAAAGVFLFVYEVCRRLLRAHGHFGGIPNPNLMKQPESLEALEVMPTPRPRELSMIETPEIV